MTTTTTDGRRIVMPDVCQSCNLDTAGNHQANCLQGSGDELRWPLPIIRPLVKARINQRIVRPPFSLPEDSDVA